MSGVRIPPPRPPPFGCATKKGVNLRVSAAGSLLALLDGGCSSPGRAPDCGSGGSGFETRQPPHPFCAQVAEPCLVEALRAICLLTAVSQILPGAFLSGGGRATSFTGRKKKGAFHAPKVGVSGLGCLAVLGHP